MFQYVCTRLYRCACEFLCGYACVCVCVGMYKLKFVCVCVCVSMYKHKFVCVCVCVCVSVSVCACACVRAYVCARLHPELSSLLITRALSSPHTTPNRSSNCFFLLCIYLHLLRPVMLAEPGPGPPQPGSQPGPGRPSPRLGES